MKKKEMLFIHNFINNKNKKIAIYGAGAYAHILYAYIQLNNLKNQIEFFVVTKSDNNPKDIYGKEVKTLSQVQEELINYQFIIAMGEKNSHEVYYNLQKFNVNEIILINEEIIQEVVTKIFDKLKVLPIQRNKIFVDCFGGLGYRCNCKYIAEELKDKQKNVELVWLVSNLEEKDMPDGIKLVKKFSLDYYKELCTAGIWIGNDGCSLFVRKRKEQYYLNTWHGTGPFKKVNASLYEGDESKRKYYEELNSIIDVFISNSNDNSDMFRESFCFRGEIYECGSPRNDIFFRENNFKEKICSKLDIDINNKIVLYAPTFRDGDARSFEYYDLDMKQILKVLSERFHNDFVLLYRFHHRLYKYDRCKNFYPEGYNVTLYPDIQELLVTADVLITDYSSVMWDFSLQKKPVFLYHNDQSEYENDRGFYCPPREWPYPQAHSHKEMEEIIRGFDEKIYIRDLEKFFDKYKSFDDGHASEKVVERIMDVIEHPGKYGKE